MIWLWVVGYFAVGYAVAYIVGRYGDLEFRDKVAVVGLMWPVVLAVTVPFATLFAFEVFKEIGERHRK